MLQAYSQLNNSTKEQHPLLIAGGKRKYLNHLKIISKNLGLEKHVLFAGYVPIELMPSLYREAFALIFPSLYEGFGIPLLEAMACGCPVITSETSSMPEVCGDAALYFNPLDKKSITIAFNKLIADPILQNELREKGIKRARNFSWKNTAVSVKKIIENKISPINI